MRMAEYLESAGAEDRGAEAMFALRSGTSALRVDDDRRHGIAHENRICRMCNLGEVEDAHHVLVRCPAHATARASLLSKLPPPLRDLHDQNTFNSLMGAASLRTACPDGVRRRAATDAVKAFWMGAFAHREQALQ